MLKCAPEVIATDSSCGAVTELTRLVIDRGISFDQMVKTITDGEDNAVDKKSEEDKSNTMYDKDRDGEDDHCKSGFYISKRKIAGRRLIMFAERKVKQTDGADPDFIDPLRLMIISRPNTGKNPCEMPSQELRYKYKLLLSSHDILNYIQKFNGELFSHSDGKEKSKHGTAQYTNALISVRSKLGSTVADLWDDAYVNSNFEEHKNGLAPRICEIGLLTGAVLHILPSLEKAVQFMPQNQRSLRVMRVELSDSRQKIVGIKFPVTEGGIVRLMAEMKEVANARQGLLGSPSFSDDTFTPLDQKALLLAVTERKTMKSFFNAATSNTHGESTSCESSNISSVVDTKQGNWKVQKFCSPPLPKTSEKRQKTNSSRGPAKKKAKTASIASFFGKKNDY